MDKTTLVETLKTWLVVNNHAPDRVTVTHGGALLLTGLTTSTNDIDIDVPIDIYMKHLHVVNVKPRLLFDNTYALQVTDNISIRIAGENALPIHKCNTFEGIKYLHAKDLLRSYKVMGRDKDVEKIKLLEEHLGLTNTPPPDYPITDSSYDDSGCMWEDNALKLISQIGVIYPPKP